MRKCWGYKCVLGRDMVRRGWIQVMTLSSMEEKRGEGAQALAWGSLAFCLPAEREHAVWWGG